jgi:quercetin dioxygenase-like cupin family protein
MTNEARSVPRQIGGTEDKALHTLAAGDSFHDLRHVRHGDAAVKKMIGLDQNADAAGALIETARGADAGLDLGQPARGELFLQGEAHFLRTSSGAAALRVIFRAPVNADKEIALSLRHGAESQPPCFAQIALTECRSNCDFYEAEHPRNRNPKIMKKILVPMLVTAVWAFSSFANAEEKKVSPKKSGDENSKSAAVAEHKMFSPSEVKWMDGPPFLPPGVKLAVLEGDPGKAGPFTIRLQFSEGYKIPAHTHPTAERVTVISGTVYLGMGDKLDEAAGHEMVAGSFAVMPAGMKHFAYAKAEAVVQVHGTGPFAIKYVNPADDPRNAKK